MLKHNNYENMNLQQILETFSHYQQVNFGFYCAKEAESFTNDPRVIDCNQQIQRWLNGDKTVDLELARTNASAVSAVSISAVFVVNAAVDAAYATYYVTSAASRAAIDQSYKLYPNDREQRIIAYNQFFNEYCQIAQNWLSLWEIPNFPKESDFPIFDYLQDYNLISSLLPKKEDYYYLNLNGFNIKHVNEAELLKMIDTTHIKNIIRRIVNNDLSQQLQKQRFI